MASCQYLIQRAEETYSKAAEREIEDCPRTENEESDDHFATEIEEKSGVERAGSVKREMLTEEAVPKFCSLFAETALQLINREESEKT